MRRLILALALMLVPAVAGAHIALDYPPARTTSLKIPVCGAANSVRGTNVTFLPPGATITVRWHETVGHPSHYRIAFDDDGQDFGFPIDYDTSTQGVDPTVLIDLIPDQPGMGVYAQDITLPNIECTNCTLQVIQLMTDKPPYSTNYAGADPNANDIYFQCADITLTSTPPPDAAPGSPDAAPGSPDAGGNPDQGSSGGCRVSAGGPSGILTVLGVVGLLGRRRRRT